MRALRIAGYVLAALLAGAVGAVYAYVIIVLVFPTPAAAPVPAALLSGALGG